MFCQTLLERGIELAIAAEPYIVQDRDPNWVGDECGSVAIVRVAADNFPCLNVIESGTGYAAGKWGSISVIGCYAPPSWDLARFGTQQIGDAARSILPPSLYFNAKSPA